MPEKSFMRVLTSWAESQLKRQDKSTGFLMNETKVFTVLSIFADFTLYYALYLVEDSFFYYDEKAIQKSGKAGKLRF